MSPPHMLYALHGTSTSPPHQVRNDDLHAALLQRALKCFPPRLSRTTGTRTSKDLSCLESTIIGIQQSAPLNPNPNRSLTMPREVSDIKQFIEICRRKDASSARIKRNRKSQQIKFKVRCHRFLYTLVLKDSDKADKLKQSLPPGLTITDIPKKNKKGKRTAV
ncbi:MAG: hypothetical protein Q9205_000264 [Flavoplaca limonia]